MADYGDKAFEQLRKWEHDDEKHVAYLAEERKELDRLGAWGDIIDAVRKGEKTTNPNNLIVAWLFGMSQIDPMLPRTFIHDPNGIKERSYHFVSTDGRDIAVHFMSHVCLADGSVLRVNDIRPGCDLASNEPFKVDLIYPSFDTFVETHSNGVVISDLSFMPIAGQHFFKQSNELPDIDVDFPPSILSKIVPLARKMYGDDRVAGVCTYMRSGVRSVIKDVARVFELPFKEVNDITTILGNESNKMNWLTAIDNFEELRQFIKNYPQASNIMSILNSRVKSVGTHASALIISSVPIAGKIPMIRQAGERDEMVSSWVEGQARLELSVFGFCKFDRLGLQTLDDLAMCLDLLYSRGQLSREDGIFRLPGRKNWSDLVYLTDKKALKAAARGETNGVFQFDSDGIRHLLEHIRVDKFSELVAANALYRPGVMSAVVDGIKGGHEAYYKRKHGQITWNLHPSLEPILGDTYGLMIYQEQVMKVLEKIGGIALPDCDAVRKAISKKKLKVIAQYKPVFVRNAMKILECDEAEAEQWWNNIENWSGYGFNKSHSLAYAIVAMRTLYLKTHYPLEFFCSFMSSIKKSKDGYAKLRTMCADADRFGIDILGVDINESSEWFSICPNPDGEGEVLRFGFAYVRGVGKKAADIMAGQPYKSFADFLVRGTKQKTAVENLIDAGAFDSLHPNRRALKLFYDEWTSVENKGVGRQMFKKFMAFLDLTKSSHPYLYNDYCAFLDSGGFSQEETVEEPSIDKPYFDNTDEDELLIDKFDEVIPDKPIESTPLLATFAMDDESSDKSSQTKKPKRLSLCFDDFARYVRERFAPSLPDVEPYMIGEAIEFVEQMLPTPTMPDCVDFTGREKCQNAQRVYGEIMPFEHPLTWVRRSKSIRRISTYGHEDTNGERQEFIDGYVFAINARDVKPKPRADGTISDKKPGKFYRITLDDGYDRVGVTCWNTVWNNKTYAMFDENGEVCQDYSMQLQKMVPIEIQGEAPCDVIELGKCVRLYVDYDEKYGFKISALPMGKKIQPAYTIPMKRIYDGAPDGDQKPRQ